MNNTQLLLINDMCGYGKVALSAMLPVLSHMGYRIHNLPTALVSDTLNYPKFYIHDTTEYVRQSLAIWEELGFEFDAISTGFIVTEEETRIISDFCHRRAAKGTKVFVDPIMGDNGRLYAGVPESTIGLMRDLVACADYTVPNYTEACLLTDTPMREGITAGELGCRLFLQGLQILLCFNDLTLKRIVLLLGDLTVGKLLIGLLCGSLQSCQFFLGSFNGILQHLLLLDDQFCIGGIQFQEFVDILQSGLRPLD